MMTDALDQEFPPQSSPMLSMMCVVVWLGWVHACRCWHVCVRFHHSRVLNAMFTAWLVHDSWYFCGTLKTQICKQRSHDGQSMFFPIPSPHVCQPTRSKGSTVGKAMRHIRAHVADPWPVLQLWSDKVVPSSNKLSRSPVLYLLTDTPWERVYIISWQGLIGDRYDMIEYYSADQCFCDQDSCQLFIKGSGLVV